MEFGEGDEGVEYLFYARSESASLISYKSLFPFVLV